ncbi:hypothetical protein [Candidatus Thiosymbion oneisti]|uniref:hypothetical protein n=1 Tax=Candidatus Thiosymbion oneisti TaxID=589554 RepID=UPI0013FDED59|nr:hypothetical protein [Candidatus Thiosymbion oneisti]
MIGIALDAGAEPGMGSAPSLITDFVSIFAANQRKWTQMINYIHSDLRLFAFVCG